jgi:hypothetical protein
MLRKGGAPVTAGMYGIGLDGREGICWSHIPRRACWMLVAVSNRMDEEVRKLRCPSCGVLASLALILSVVG